MELLPSYDSTTVHNNTLQSDSEPESGAISTPISSSNSAPASGSDSGSGPETKLSSSTRPSKSAHSISKNSSTTENPEPKFFEKSPAKAKLATTCRYCEKSSVESLKTVYCLDCGGRCHIDCIHSLQNFKENILLGDDFFYFKCFFCTENNEEFKRYHLSWVDVVHIALFNLTHGSAEILNQLKAEKPGKDKESSLFSAAEQGPQTYDDNRVYFHYKADVSRFIDFNWSYFWNKPRGETWINSASSALSTNSTENVAQDGRFESGKAKYNKNGMWALTDDSRLPSSYDLVQPQQRTRTVMFDISSDGSLVPITDAKITHSASSTSITGNSGLNSTLSSSNTKKKRRADVENKTTPKSKKSKLKTTQSSTRISNRAKISNRNSSNLKIAYTSYDENHVELRSTKRPPVLAENYAYVNTKTKEWSVKMWPDLDNPTGSVIMQSEITHSAPQMNFEGSRSLTVWNNYGYTVSKCSHGTASGTYYYEAEILEGLKPTWNVRIGWGQISANLQAPCGYDHYSYSMRANPGTIFHASIGQMYGDSLSVGDVLGVLIQLPEELDSEYQKDIRARVWDPLTPYKPFDYRQPKTSSSINQGPLPDKSKIKSSGKNKSSSNSNTNNSDNSKNVNAIGNMDWMNEYSDYIELPPIPVVKDSEIVFFKNGKCMGSAFRGLFLGKYYPMVSSYMGGRVRINFGDATSADGSKGFKYSPPELWNGKAINCIDSLGAFDSPVNVAAAKTEPKPEAQPNPKPESELKLEPEPEPEPEAQPKTQIQAQTASTAREHGEVLANNVTTFNYETMGVDTNNQSSKKDLINYGIQGIAQESIIIETASSLNQRSSDNALQRRKDEPANETANNRQNQILVTSGEKELLNTGSEGLQTGANNINGNVLVSLDKIELNEGDKAKAKTGDHPENPDMLGQEQPASIPLLKKVVDEEPSRQKESEKELELEQVKELPSLLGGSQGDLSDSNNEDSAKVVQENQSSN